MRGVSDFREPKGIPLAPEAREGIVRSAALLGDRCGWRFSLRIPRRFCGTPAVKVFFARSVKRPTSGNESSQGCRRKRRRLPRIQQVRFGKETPTDAFVRMCVLFREAFLNSHLAFTPPRIRLRRNANCSALM